jgi:hypothetical protein
MDEYEKQFMEETEGAARAAVKRLTAKIYSELTEATINAPDWCVPTFGYLALEFVVLIRCVGTRSTRRAWRATCSGRTSPRSRSTTLSPSHRRTSPAKFLFQ